MAYRDIVKKGDPILTKRSREVVSFDTRLHTLIDDMRETLTQANGAGLAAVQVGVLRRVMIIDTEETGCIEFINPVITAADGEQDGVEGCLSVPGIYGYVSRPMTVTVNAQDRNGKSFCFTGEELAARALCHEIEHLDGRLFMEKVSRYIEEEEA
jgi:peptide deformylase